MLGGSLKSRSTSLQLQVHGVSAQICKNSISRSLRSNNPSPFQPILRSSSAGRLCCKPIRLQSELPTSRKHGRTLKNLSVVHFQVRTKGRHPFEKLPESQGWRQEPLLKTNQSSELRASKTVDKFEGVLNDEKAGSSALKRQNGMQKGAQYGSQNGTMRSPQSVPESSSPPPPADDKPSGSLLGAVALITGTSVGAGILALPGISAPAGFVPATSIMVACWSFLVGEALLLAEVNVELLKQVAGQTRGSDVLSLRTMAQKTLGPTGGAAATLAYVFLTYTLLTAYVAKSADVLSLLLGLPSQWSGVAFVGFFGALLLVGGTIFTDYLNQAATATMLVLFLVMVVGGSFFADWSILEQADWSAAPAAVPIIFLSLVYHDLTPVICSYLGGDIRRIRQAIVLGSLVPLLMFVSCNAVALAISPVTGGGDPLNIMIRLGGPGPAAMIEAFSLLAITTSFIGTILGATEFALEQFGGLQLAGKQAPAVEEPSNNSVDRQSAFTTKVLSQEGLKEPSSKSEVWSQEELDDASVQEEIDRLQKRVNEKLVQWDSRFMLDRTLNPNGNGHRGEVYSIEESTNLREDGFEGQRIFVDSVKRIGRLVAGDSRSDRIDLETRVGDSLDAVGNRISSNGRSSTSKTRSGPEMDGQDAANGNLWSMEAPQTGTSNLALRAGAFFVVLVPPVAVASQYPDAFIQASNIAGAYGMTTLYGFFPVAMAWSMRSKVMRWKSDPTKYSSYRVLVPGGRFTLVLMGLYAAGIMAGQASLDSKLAAGALSDLLTGAEPTLKAMQQAASQAVSALEDVRAQLQTLEDGLQVLRKAEAFAQTAVEGLADRTSGLQASIRSTMQEGASQVGSALADARAQVPTWDDGSVLVQSAEHSVQTAIQGLTDQTSGLQDSVRSLLQEGASGAVSAVAEISAQVQTSEVFRKAKTSLEAAVEGRADLDSVHSLMQEGVSGAVSALAELSAQVQAWQAGSDMLQSAEHSVQTAVAKLVDLDHLRSLMQEGASQAASAFAEASTQVQSWEAQSEAFQTAKDTAQIAVEALADLDSVRSLMQDGASQAVGAVAKVTARVQTWEEGSEALGKARHFVQTAIDGGVDLTQKVDLQETLRAFVEKAGSLPRQNGLGQ